MAERWDCVFVDRIDEKGRLYLTQPQKYGFMYRRSKIRKSIPKVCGQSCHLEGLANENKVLHATAIATALNRNEIKSSNGLIIRGFTGRTPFPGLQTALITTRRETLREKGATGWLIYVSPREEFHNVEGRFIGKRLLPNQIRKIMGCIKTIENEW